MSGKFHVSCSVMFLLLVLMGTACDQNKPDLIVKTITLTPANPTTSDVIKFEASIVNIGNCTAPLTSAAMWVGGETNPGIFNVPALNPGAVHVINRSEKLNVAQNYRVTVHANHGNNADECDDTNNEMYKDFRVQ